jgi:hypothetical protein
MLIDAKWQKQKWNGKRKFYSPRSQLIIILLWVRLAHNRIRPRRWAPRLRSQIRWLPASSAAAWLPALSYAASPPLPPHPPSIWKETKWGNRQQFIGNVAVLLPVPTRLAFEYRTLSLHNIQYRYSAWVGWGSWHSQKNLFKLNGTRI